MKETARGVIIKDEKILLIHRIKDNIEYYVVPGGGIEEGETPEQAVIREMYEEIGIHVEPVKELFELESDNKLHHFILCHHISGEIGTGQGPESASKEYSKRGQYLPEMINLSDLKEIPLQDPFKRELLKVAL